MGNDLLGSDEKLTMTKLYNEVEALRQKCDSSERAYPLLVAHEKLDEAVAAAYGWEWPLEEEEVLGRLLLAGVYTFLQSVRARHQGSLRKALGAVVPRA